jgi:hypothetical protein
MPSKEMRDAALFVMCIVFGIAGILGRQRGGIDALRVHRIATDRRTWAKVFERGYLWGGVGFLTIGLLGLAYELVFNNLIQLLTAR